MLNGFSAACWKRPLWVYFRTINQTEGVSLGVSDKLHGTISKSYFPTWASRSTANQHFTREQGVSRTAKQNYIYIFVLGGDGEMCSCTIHQNQIEITLLQVRKKGLMHAWGTYWGWYESEKFHLISSTGGGVWVWCFGWAMILKKNNKKTTTLDCCGL